MWRCGKHNSLRKDNKGMTLIEVIVAMGILAVVVTPTLRMFASSSSVNLRAKQRQRATVVGESIMESFKAYNMQTLCKQFTPTPPATASYKGVSSFDSAKLEAYYPNPASPANPLIQSAFHVNGVLNQDAQKYRFELQGVKSDISSDKQKYDIEITAIPHKESVLRFEEPNAYSDAIISIGENIVSKSSVTGDVMYATSVLEQLKEKAKDAYVSDGHGAGYSVDTASSSISDLKRTIDIKVTDDVPSKVQTVSYSLTYNCKVTLSCKYTNPTTGVVTDITPKPTYLVEYRVVLNESASGEAQYTLMVYNNALTMAGVKVNERQCKLDNIYLYYYPVNKTVYGNNCEDVIKLDAAGLNGALYSGDSEQDRMSGKAPLNFIIARQMPTMLTPVQIQDDASYMYTVNGALPAGGGGKVNIYHNFCEKFSDDYTSAYETLDAANARITGGFSSCKEISKDYLRDINVIYDLDVKIYADDTAAFDSGNLLAEFTGTKNE